MRKQTSDYEFQNFGQNPSYHNNFINPPTVLGGHPMAGMAGNNQMGSGGNPQTSSGPMILNPIDRLYSMQNMYFCGEKMADDQM